MADPLPSTESLRVPGRLCADPTSIGTFPHGGTDLGHVVAIDFFPNPVSIDIEDEGIGGERSEAIFACERPLLQVVLGAMTTAMLSRIMATASGGGGKYGVSGDDSRLGSAGEIKLLFSPRSASHPGLVLYRALPWWAGTAQLSASIDRGVGVAVAFYGLRDATKGVYMIDRIGDITL